MTAAFYSIVQYLPHPMRQEGVNVGVVVLVPGEVVRVHFADRNEQVKRRVGAGGYDERRLDVDKRGLARRLAEIAPTVDAFAHLAATEAGVLRLTPAMPTRLTTIEETIGRLFPLLVDDPPRAKRARLRGPDIGRYFRSLAKQRVGVYGRTEVTVPTGEKFSADYAFKNGVNNLVKSAGFGTARGQAMGVAADLGAKEILLQNTKWNGEPCHLIVVGDAPATMMAPVARILKLYGAEYYPMRAIEDLVARVEHDTQHHVDAGN